ncbi:hypothetical protein [Enterovirga rhinocerotis]|uniref:hypothetical protein n=1 Tax=Enterovirga rhinocerotis TaxID=1339210 RepID=UPI00105CBBE9|nr:hypothetical protein [Enterovirga rhinocerotis]
MTYHVAISQWETDGGSCRLCGPELSSRSASSIYNNQHKEIVSKLADAHMLMAKLVISSDRGRWWNEDDLDIYRLEEIDNNLSIIISAINSIERYTENIGVSGASKSSTKRWPSMGRTK